MTILPTQLLQKAGIGRRWLLAAALGLLGASTTQAQTLNYPTTGSTNTLGTYTDLGTSGTVIATANTDDANSAAQNIGFTFNYNNTAFSQFVLNTNGAIRLGSAPPSAVDLYYENSATSTATDPLFSTNPADVNLLMPFNFDLVPGTSPTEYRMYTTGAIGARVCTIQWKNVKDNDDATTLSQFNNFSFQLKLYETGLIEFVYGPSVMSTNAAAGRYPDLGLKGSGLASGQVNVVLKAAADAWSAATFSSVNYTSTAYFTLAKPALPDVGRTYRFTPTASTLVDAGVQTVYTQGKVALPVSSPHVVRAVVVNNGGSALANLPVTLTVTGAGVGATPFTNTQTVTTLAAGATATVTFTGYPLAAAGTNTVVVSVNAPADAVTSNNSVTKSQVVGNSLSYSDPVAPVVAGTAGAGTNSILFVKYPISGSTTVTAITPTLRAGTGTTTTYQVQIYGVNATTGEPGTLLYTSPTRTAPATAGPDPVTIPPTAVAGSFFVATKQLVATGFGVGYQTESPLRTGTFFFSTNGTTFTDLAASTIPTARLMIEATMQNAAVPYVYVYATVPYSMDFENTWLSVAAARDAPGVNWRNNVSTGDASWRRDDDGASANWPIVTNGSYTPTSSPLNGANGTHSARLHSSLSSRNGPSPLTLAINLSQAGVKTLTFDYRNPTGQDSIGVYLSNDGGQTRSILRGYYNDATWASKTIPLNSTSATALIIFEGYFYSPNNSDIAIDNVNVSVVTGTRATLGGGAVSIYPNPAHQAFTVAIPAVNGAHTATLSLVNGLGQVLRIQAISLTTGTTQAQVDATGLAAGIYTVRVQAGTETANVRLTVQ